MKFPFNFLLAAFLVFGFGCMRAQSDEAIQQVCLKEQCVEVEVAKTFDEVSKGLMFREYMEDNHGMLFIFEDTQPRAFWMKNTLIPLDIIWIGENKQIVDISNNVPPCDFDPCPTYSTDSYVKYVLEINAGGANKRGWKSGDVFEF